MSSMKSVFPPPVLTLLALLAAAVAWVMSSQSPRDWGKTLLSKWRDGSELSIPQQALVNHWQASWAAVAVLGFGVLIQWAISYWENRVNSNSRPPRQPTPPKPWQTEASPMAARAFRYCLVILPLLAAIHRAPRLTHSLWNDESLAMGIYTVGTPLQQPKKYELSSSWKQALQENPIGNNHILCTLETRFMHKLWQRTPAGQARLAEEPLAFEESWLRFPAFCWSIVAMVVGGSLARNILGPAAGIATLLLIGLHPWSLRFAAETRGYGGAMAAVVLVGWFCERIWTTGPQSSRRRTAWLFIGLALSLLTAVLGVVITAPILVAICLPLALGLWKAGRFTALRWLIVAGFGAAAAWLPLGWSALKFGSAYQTSHADVHFPRFGLIVFQDLLSGFASGEDWNFGRQAWRQRAPWANALLTIGFYGMLMLGIRQCWKLTSGRLVVAALAATTLVFLVQNWSFGHGWLAWYWSPLLPVVVLTMAAAARGSRRIAAGFFLIWLIGVSGTLHLLHTERQPMKAAAAFIKHHHPKARYVYFGMSYRSAPIYLKDTQILNTYDEIDEIKELAAFQSAAEADGVPAIVWCGGDQRGENPAIIDWLAANRYQIAQVFQGTDVRYDFYVWFPAP